MQSVSDDTIRERLNDLSSSDKALFRTNPFALFGEAKLLVTADEVAMSGLSKFQSGFVCPKCSGLMRHYQNGRGTPFFAHVHARQGCPSGIETPSHLCIKRGLHSVGFDCEHIDKETGFRFDAYHNESETAAEVVSSGIERYFVKIRDMHERGRRCWWIADSGSRSLGSRDGSERLCLLSYQASRTIVVSGLFKPKAEKLWAAIPSDMLFAFYLGLIWKSVGNDTWQLLDEGHPLSVAATAEDGMKCLMVRLHQANASVAIENQRRGISRSTWFDRCFRYRGEFTLNWRGERDYVLELISGLITDAIAERSGLRRQLPGSTSIPSRPVHLNADDVIRSLHERHSASVEDAKRLRAIAEQSRTTNPIAASQLSSAVAMPLVLSESEAAGIPLRHEVAYRQSDSVVSEANRKLQECAYSSRSMSVCRNGQDHHFKLKRFDKFLYEVCDLCGVAKKLPGTFASRRL